MAFADFDTCESADDVDGAFQESGAKSMRCDAVVDDDDGSVVWRGVGPSASTVGSLKLRPRSDADVSPKALNPSSPDLDDDAGFISNKSSLERDLLPMLMPKRSLLLLLMKSFDRDFSSMFSFILRSIVFTRFAFISSSSLSS